MFERRSDAKAPRHRAHRRNKFSSRAPDHWRLRANAIAAHFIGDYEIKSIANKSINLIALERQRHMTPAAPRKTMFAFPMICGFHAR
jgi:hypothetical protein